MRNERQNALNRLREQQGVTFHDTWERDFDKNFKRMSKAVVAVWLVSILASLAITGVVIWAIIELVQHFTA